MRVRHRSSFRALTLLQLRHFGRVHSVPEQAKVKTATVSCKCLFKESVMQRLGSERRVFVA